MHPEQCTPASLAKRLKVTTSSNNQKRERYKTDLPYQTKMKKSSQANRVKTKARVEVPWEVSRGGVLVPTDVGPTLQPPPTAPKIVEVSDEDGAGGVGVTLALPKKDHEKAKTTSVPGRVETTALTTANVTSFFTPRYDAPRSKEQRAANPRPSEI